MCEPSTIAAVGLMAVQVVGTLISARQSVYQGQQAETIQYANAEIAENNAERVEQVGQVNEAQTRTDMRAEIARQRARIAAAGFDLSDGTSIDFGLEAGEQAYLESQRIRSETEDAARNYRTDAALSRAEGAHARQTGKIGAFTTIARAAGPIASSVSSFKSSRLAFRPSAGAA